MTTTTTRNDAPNKSKRSILRYKHFSSVKQMDNPLPTTVQTQLTEEQKHQIDMYLGVDVDELITAMNTVLSPPAGADVAAAEAIVDAARDAMEQGEENADEAGVQDAIDNLEPILADFDYLTIMLGVGQEDEGEGEEAPAGNESAPAAGGKRRKTIRRKGYTRKGYTRKSGVHVKGSRVPSGLIKDVGHPGKGVLGTGKPGIGPLKKGDLESVGYHRTAKASVRHRALNKAIKKYGSLSTYRKLNAVAVYTKRTAPAASKTFKADRNWVGRKRS